MQWTDFCHHQLTTYLSYLSPTPLPVPHDRMTRSSVRFEKVEVKSEVEMVDTQLVVIAETGTKQPRITTPRSCINITGEEHKTATAIYIPHPQSRNSQLSCHKQHLHSRLIKWGFLNSWLFFSYRWFPPPLSPKTARAKKWFWLVGGWEREDLYIFVQDLCRILCRILCSVGEEVRIPDEFWSRRVEARSWVSCWVGRCRCRYIL